MWCIPARFPWLGSVRSLELPSPSTALITVLSMWLVNQGLGFTIRHYPWTLTTFAWGPVLALGAILVMLLASVKPKLSQQGLTGYGVWLATSLVAGFGVYELVIWLACIVLGGCDSFTPPILWGIFQGNATWAIALIGIHSVLVWQTLQLSKRHANGISTQNHLDAPIRSVRP
ncbi:MAG: hypothetical protein HC772_00210 [Leptolyngbyaceae cyanobacterium CRU_2_3]|nr:hypothetical protein [Leptolyngbyaceae cyanobacterium CRU_2_3]